jgi:hypothetical protein
MAADNTTVIRITGAMGTESRHSVTAQRIDGISLIPGEGDVVLYR